MNILLVRTKANKNNTQGEIYIGESKYYTIEPPIVTNAKLDEAYAIAPGKYKLDVRNNPIAGTPAIKVFGESVLSTTAIRCCKPVGRKNNSITVLSNKDGDGDVRHVDYLAWARLLLKIKQTVQNKEEVALEIVEDFT